MGKTDSKTPATVPLTLKAINALPTGTFKLSENFYIRVRDSYRSYFVRVMRDGRRHDITIGSAREISPGVAKAAALRILADIAAGTYQFREPGAKKAAAAKPLVFSDIARQTIEATQSARHWRNAKTLTEWQRGLLTYAAPQLDAIPFQEIRTGDILSILKPLWDTKPETARCLQNRLERVFDYATFIGAFRAPNPARWKGVLDNALPSVRKIWVPKHRAAMTLEEARAFAAFARVSPFCVYRILFFGLLTCGRLHEYAAACWYEIDFENAVFTVPPERRKDGKPEPFRVPLSRQAVSFLQSLPRAPGVRHIFAQQKKDIPYDAGNIAQFLSKAVGRPVTAHGMRSTFRDWAAETGKDFFVAERCLMHAIGNAVTFAYQRSDLLEQRRVIMQEWADALLGLDDACKIDAQA